MAGIYLHIPFCKQACSYCNFHFSTSLQYKNDLLQAMYWELEKQLPLFQEPIETIYFGGGTPSLLSADEIKKLINKIAQHTSIEALKECTLEVNPDDVNAIYLQQLRGTLVNRFSMGVQSFQDEDLKWMKRAHNSQQSDRAIKSAQDKGFSQITIDLIFGIPTLSTAGWLENLHRMQAYQLPHFSAYALTVEEGTLLDYAIKKQKVSAPLEGQMAEQFSAMQDFIEQNHWVHYEISNIAREGFEARHNSNYWNNIPYLGIGPSAHSYDGKKRWWNVANNALYIKGLKNGLSISTKEILTTTEKINEKIMTRIRTKWGLDLNEIHQHFETAWVKIILQQAQKFITQGHLSYEQNQNEWGILRITKSGMLYADGIAAALFVTT